MLSTPSGLMLYGKLGLEFFSTSVLQYLNVKKRLRIVKARSYFCTISDNYNISLGNVDCLLSRIIITRNKWTCLNMLLWGSTI